MLAFSKKTDEVKKIATDVTPTMPVQNALSVVSLGGAIVNSILVPICYQQPLDVLRYMSDEA